MTPPGGKKRRDIETFLDRRAAKRRRRVFERVVAEFTAGLDRWADAVSATVGFPITPDQEGR